MRIFILSYADALGFDPSGRGRTVMVRIGGGTQKLLPLRFGALFHDVLEVHFDDITEEDIAEGGDFDDGRPSEAKPKIIDESDAAAIAEFLLRNRDCDMYVFHCAAGLSRSPAVALAWLDYLGDSAGAKQVRKGFMPNGTVHRMVLKALESAGGGRGAG